MLILAFDTTSEEGGVGIFRDTECLASISNTGQANQYSISLFEMVEQALRQAHVELREIDLYAAANGPGSFTGIRVGLAAALAWGRAFGRPVRGISVLEAMANNVPLATDWAFPIMDGRRGEFFLGSFRRKPCELPGAARPDYESVDSGWILKADALREFLHERIPGGGTATCLARAHDQAAVSLCASLPAPLKWQQVEGLLVDSIAAIARKEVQSNTSCPGAKLDAYYLRRPDAELNWKG